MPARNGTGPMGLGAATGRGLGGCIDNKAVMNNGFMGLGRRQGRGCGSRLGAGFGCGYGYNPVQYSQETRRAVLMEQKQMLEQQLSAIDESLNDN